MIECLLPSYRPHTCTEQTWSGVENMQHVIVLSRIPPLSLRAFGDLEARPPHYTVCNLELAAVNASVCQRETWVFQLCSELLKQVRP